MQKRIFAAMLAAAMLLTLAACGGSNGASSSAPASSDNSTPASSEASGSGIPADQIKAAWLYVGPTGDEGYSYMHDQARQKVAAELGIETMYVENVPEDADCEKTVRDLIDQGCNVIYATSFGHGEWAYNVAKDHPEVFFGHATGYLTADNFTTYMGRVYEPRYLSGIVAGMQTETNKIGYVAAMPIAEVYRGFAAFCLGVKSVNPDAKVEILWTNAWYDPANEKSAAQQLINNGCDIIAQHCDTTGPQTAAQDAGVWCIGYNAPTADAAPESYLTAPLFHWDAYYKADLEAIMAGTREPGQRFWGGLTTGMVSLDTLTDNCKDGIAEAVAEAQAKIESGDLFVFAGPIVDNQGNTIVAEGEKIADADLENSDYIKFYIDNVTTPIA